MSSHSLCLCCSQPFCVLFTKLGWWPRVLVSECEPLHVQLRTDDETTVFPIHVRMSWWLGKQMQVWQVLFCLRPLSTRIKAAILRWPAVYNYHFCRWSLVLSFSDITAVPGFKKKSISSIMLSDTGQQSKPVSGKDTFIYGCHYRQDQSDILGSAISCAPHESYEPPNGQI